MSQAGVDDAGSVEDMFRQAQALHQRGLLAAAERGYQALLRQQPAHAEALHMLGILALQTQRTELAVTLIRQAVALDPQHAVAHSNLGIALLALGRTEEALQSYDRAIALQPDYAEAHYNRGVLLINLRRVAAALASLDAAIALRPEFAAAHHSRGDALGSLGRYEAAVSSYDRAIALHPDHADAHHHRGKALARLQRHAAALASYEQAIALQPGHAEAHNNAAAALWQLGRYDESLAACDRAIALRPDYAEAHANRGNVLRDLSRFAEALASCDRAIALQPELAEAHANRGNALRELQRYEEALASCDRAVALAPNDAQIHINRGNVLGDLQRDEEALLCYDRAIALQPERAAGYWNKSLCLLQLGRLESGWQLYEWRRKLPKPVADRFAPRPPWRGSAPIAGRTLFIHWEQGFGDSLQFCRYAPLVRARGADVVLSVQPPLLRLVRQSMPDVHVIGGDQQPAAFDEHCPLLSLPLALGTTLATIPAATPYLHADRQACAAWRERLAALRGLKVGLVWSGARRHDHPDRPNALDQRRSITLSQYAPLADVPGISLVSLQKGEAAAQARTPPDGMVLHDWTGELDDFADTAALIAGLDLVISVDTSVAHLAGGLGKPVWVLLHAGHSWRWLSGRDDSPWYPTARLFRQPAPGKWGEVMARVAEALRGL